MKILHDLHIHTNLSSCANPETTAAAQLAAAAGDGIRVVGFSNHLWDKKIPGGSAWYRPQDVGHVLKIREELARSQAGEGMRVLFGCETEFLGDGTLALAEENFPLFDFVLVPHSHTHMRIVMPDRTAYADEKMHAGFLMESFLKVIRHPLSPRFTAIAHPFAAGTNHANFNNVQRHIPDSYLRSAFSEAAERNIGIEINGSTVNYLPEEEVANCEYRRIYTAAKECGCRFTYGSDSHSHEEERKLFLVEAFLDLCGITENDFVKI